MSNQQKIEQNSTTTIPSKMKSTINTKTSKKKVYPKSSTSKDLDKLRKSKGFRELGDMLYID
jgi:hypothetical protein